MTRDEAERRIAAYCGPQVEWLKQWQTDVRDLYRAIGYEDGVSDAIKALSAPVRSASPGPTKEEQT